MQKIYDSPFLIPSLEKQIFYKLPVLFISHIKQASVKYINIYICAYDKGIFALFC